MKAKQVRFLIPILTLFTIGAAYAGGWSVITVHDLPEYAIAGKPLVLTFSVRQHGNHPISGLQPTLVATSPEGLKVTATAAPTTNEGEYRAKLLLGKPAEWTIRIDGGFNPEDKARAYNSTTLAPLKVIAAEVPAISHRSKAARGADLFLAKGCTGCHNPGSGRDLRGTRFAADYLTKFLADPSIRQVDMPNLKLSEDEIGALAAYLLLPQ
jgi:mono/diheme cytochrome c family protein